MASITQFDELKVGPNLRPFLVSNEFLSRTALFERKDAEAVAEQKSLFSLLDAINRMILIIAILSGIVLAASLVRAEPRLLESWVGVDRIGQWSELIILASRWLAALVGVLTLVVTVLGQLARDGDRLGRWRARRADAEAARAGRFTALARSAAAAGKDAAREALDYVRLGLLEDQRSWYISRAARHRESVGITSVYNIVALLLSAAASAAALTVSFSGVTQALMVVGVLAAAFTAYAVDRENLYRDRSNAALYAKTAEELEALAAASDKVRAEIDGGNAEAVVAYTDLVAEKLQSEHRQWAAGLDVTAELMKQLDQRLQQAKAADPKPKVDITLSAIEPASGRVASELAHTADPDKRNVPQQSPQSVASIAASLRQWGPLLSAAANVLPPPQGERAGMLVTELTQVLSPLDGDAPVSSAIGAAATLGDRLKAENPLGQWFSSAAPQIGSVLGTVLPPLSLVLGIAGVGAQLGEAAYRRWVSRVLDTPFSPGLVEPKAINSTVVMAALDLTTIFAEIFAKERKSDLATMSLIGELTLIDPDRLWSIYTDRFPGGRNQFDQGVEEMRRRLRNRAVDNDLHSVSTASLPDAAAPAAVINALPALNRDPAARAALLTTVQLLHELRDSDVDDPVNALRSALGGEKIQ